MEAAEFLVRAVIHRESWYPLLPRQLQQGIGTVKQGKPGLCLDGDLFFRGLHGVALFVIAFMTALFHHHRNPGRSPPIPKLFGKPFLQKLRSENLVRVSVFGHHVLDFDKPSQILNLFRGWPHQGLPIIVGAQEFDFMEGQILKVGIEPDGNHRSLDPHRNIQPASGQFTGFGGVDPGGSSIHQDLHLFHRIFGDIQANRPQVGLSLQDVGYVDGIIVGIFPVPGGTKGGREGDLCPLMGIGHAFDVFEFPDIHAPSPFPLVEIQIHNGNPCGLDLDFKIPHHRLFPVLVDMVQFSRCLGNPPGR